MLLIAVSCSFVSHVFVVVIDFLTGNISDMVVFLVWLEQRLDLILNVALITLIPYLPILIRFLN